MEKRIDRLRNKSFKKTLLDSPVPNKKIKFSLRGNKSKLQTIKLPKPLKPTKYLPPKPTPKPTPKPRNLPLKKPDKVISMLKQGLMPEIPPVQKPRIKSKMTIPSPRVKSTYPKAIELKVKKFIDEITPYYKPEAIESFNKILKDTSSLRVIITKKKKALRRAVKALQVAIRVQKDPARQLYYTTLGVAKELQSIFNRDGAMKAQVTLHVIFKKKKIRYRDDGQAEEVFEYKDAYFNSTAFTILDNDDIIESLDKAAEEINNKIAFWLSEGSGWTLVEIRSHFVNIVKYLPLRGNSYIQLPEELRHHNKGLINLKNNDDKCFLWDHVRHLNPRKVHPERITKEDRESAKKLDYSSGITFPVTRNQIN